MKFTFDKAVRQKLTVFLKKYKYLLIVAAVGITLLLLPTVNESNNEPNEASAAADTGSVEQSEARIKQTLEKIDGVGKTEVVLTLKQGVETLYATDTRSGSSETVIISSGSGVQQAVVTVKNYPKYQGALIVCEGGGSAAVKLVVTEAVAALTGLTADKITVCKRESGS